MVEEAKKGIPLADMEKCNEEYDDLILGLIKFEKRGLIKRQELEEKLIPAVVKVQESLTNLLIKNGIRTLSQDHQERKFLSMISDNLMKIQNDCINLRGDKHKTSIILSEIKTSLESSFGGQVTNEIDRVLSSFNGMIDSFETHFQDLKSKLQTLEDKFDANERYLKTLHEELKIKEVQIQEYKFKDGKNETLKEVIEEFKHSHKDPHCSKPHSAEPAPASDIPHLPCYDLPEISSIKYDGQQVFKKDKFVDEDGVEQTVEGEWLDGVPHGICIVENDDGRGIITFTKGK